LALVLVGAGCAATATDDPSAVASNKGSSAEPSTNEAPSAGTDEAGKPGKIPFKMKDGTIRDVAVSIRGGRAWIGDMGFGPADEMTPRSYSIADTDRRWPNATVPYCFYDGSDNAIRLPEHTREAFREAVKYIQDHVPSIKFVERACSDAVNLLSSEGYLFPTPGDGVLVVMEQAGQGGHADIGYENNSRSITLSDGIGVIDPDTGKRKAVGTVVHELGHSLGLRHEHQRPDRGDYVNVCPSNIPSSKMGDYVIIDPSDNEMLAPYQYFSKMHYDLTTYDTGLPAIGCEGYAMYPLHDTLPQVSGGQDIMGSGDFSSHDMNSLMLMYGPALGTSETGDAFGSAMAVGDFDLDGYDDVIIGAPGEKVGSGERSGTIYAYKGTYRSPAPWKIVRESAIAAEEADDKFGSAFAVGDFVRQDGCTPSTPDSCELPYPDLAVGVPGKRDGTKAQIGAVMMYMGGRFKGAEYRKDPALEKGCSDFPECRGTTGEPLAPLPVILRAADARGNVGSGGDLFGHSLAAGDFDGDGEMDLAVGAPGYNGIGRVYIYRGVDMKKGVFISREITPVGAANVAGAKFGWALAAGDFDLDGKDDLAVGAPGAGSGQVVYFKGQGAAPVLTGGRTLLFPGGANTPTGNAQFGYALSANHLLNTSRASLVIGAPGQFGLSTYAGAAHLYTWGPLPTTGPSSDGLIHRQTILSPGSRGDRFGHSVLIYSPIGSTWNDVAIGAPGRSTGKGAVTIYDATSATNLSLLTTVNGSATDGSYGMALAAGSVKISVPLQGLPELPNATLFVGSPLAVNASAQAGRVAGIGFNNGNAAAPVQVMSFSQSLKSPYTR